MLPRRRDEDGASAVEYGLIVFAVAALIVIVVFSLGAVNEASYQDSCTKIRDGYTASGATAPNCS